MMKLHILSDLHLEVSKFEPIKTNADVVILAGDIGKIANGIGWARESFLNQEIIYVPGNHEFYGTQRLEALSRMRIEAHRCGVHLLDDDEITLGHVRFLGSTLWTDFLLFGGDLKNRAMSAGQYGLNDFRLIHEGVKGHFSPTHSVDLHEKSLAWLKSKLDPLESPINQAKTVVVTHHLPSSQSVAERYKCDMLSACFASELDFLFGKMDLWVHGHTHDNMDYTANGTRVICNPRGYVTFRGQENFNFKPDLTVEI